MAANYNNSAWFYDKLCRLVYGRALIDAQVYLLQFIPLNSKILIVGGGTGWILDEITKLNHSSLQITYVEVASKMVARSRKRNIGSNGVTFINDAVETVSLPGDFDVVITPFLFDNFTEQTLQKVFSLVHSMIKPSGLWLNADFQLTGKWWQHAFIKTMYFFFRLVCNIEASKLPDIEKQFIQQQYSVINAQTFFGEFIISKVYCAP